MDSESLWDFLKDSENPFVFFGFISFLKVFAYPGWFVFVFLYVLFVFERK